MNSSLNLAVLAAAQAASGGWPRADGGASSPCVL